MAESFIPSIVTKQCKLIGFLSIAFALFTIAGGPLIVFQGVAWVGMIQEYSKQDTLANALQKTFSGKHPCSLCKRIAKQSKKEQKTAALLKTEKSLKVSFSTPLEKTAFLLPTTVSYSQSLSSTYQSIFYDPPEPYPRA